MDDADPSRGRQRADLHTPHLSSVAAGGVSGVGVSDDDDDSSDAMEEGAEGEASMDDGGGLHRLFSMVMAGLVRSLREGPDLDL